MYNSIFQKPWWLDAVAPGRWKEVAVERHGEIVARMPYVVKRRFGLTYLTMPSLTHTLGPWLQIAKLTYAKRLAEQKDLMSELITQLPPFDLFTQHFHYSISNWLPFHWHGFKQTTRYTYVLEDLSDLDKIWEGFANELRRTIKNARDRFQLEVCSGLGVDTLLDLTEMTFKRQKLPLPYSRDFVKRLHAACEVHNACKMFFARDADGKVHAADYIIWDEDSAYYLIGGADPRFRNSGATSLCMWEAIKFASGVTKRLDFEGSMIESVERFFRKFGAVQKRYFNITAICWVGHKANVWEVQSGCITM
jgi:lipid II:glycine glycyltransferase (peptidoglycan interpeptide bridge formation enzyme)